MAEFPPDNPVEEEEERTESADPAQTTEEEERTEQADPDNSTEEQVQVEEDEPKEETIESLLDFDPFENLHLEDQVSDEGNRNPQEESITIPRGDLTMNRGSTSFASNQNRPLVPPNPSGMQQQPSPVMLTTWRGYEAGFAPHFSPWRPQSIWPGSAVINHNYALWRHQNTFHNFAPWRHGNTYQIQAPMWPMMYNQDQIVPNVVPDQAPMWPMMYNQQQQFNQRQHFGFPIDMTHQAAPTAAAGSPRPELNHQQMQQLQLQTQQPTQSQGFNAGPSSDQSQD